MIFLSPSLLGEGFRERQKKVNADDKY